MNIETNVVIWKNTGPSGALSVHVLNVDGTNTFTYNATSSNIYIQIRQAGTYYLDNIRMYRTYQDTVFVGGFDVDMAYRYGFGGHEKVDEISGDGNVVDMGDRWLDVRLGRTPKMDAMAHLYPGISPYAYAMNTPIQAIDPDGKVVIFINGNHYGDGGKASYWRQYNDGKEVYAFDKQVMRQFNDYKAVYKDGAMGGWAPFNTKGNLSAQTRRNAGFFAAMNDAKAILDNLDADETIKIVTHSMGAAYAKGYITGLKNYMEKNNITDVKIEIEVDFAPFQPDDHSNSAIGSRSPAEAEKGAVPTFQASHDNDIVAGNKPMNGAEQIDTSNDPGQGHSIFDFKNTVKKLGGILEGVRKKEGND